MALRTPSAKSTEGFLECNHYLSFTARGIVREEIQKGPNGVQGRALILETGLKESAETDPKAPREPLKGKQ